MSKRIEARRSGPCQGLRVAQALQASKCRGRVRKEPGRRIWCGNWASVSLSLTWRVLLISTLLVALTTPWLVIFCPGAPDSYRIRATPHPHFIRRETEAWRSSGLSCPPPPPPHHPPHLSQLFLLWMEKENPPREVWEGWIWPEASGCSGPGVLSSFAKKLELGFFVCLVIRKVY